MANDGRAAVTLHRCTYASTTDKGLGESGFAEAGNGIGGFRPELRFFYGAAGLTPCEPDSAPRNSTDGQYHLPFHASTLATRDHS